MTDFSITPYQQTYQAIWDNVVRASKNGNFLHLRNYMDYHAHRFDERSVIVEKKGKAVAVFPCNFSEGQIVSHGGLTYGGLIYGHELHAAEVIHIFENLLAHFRINGSQRLLYKAIPHIFHRYPCDEDLYALFRMNARLVRRDLSSVILNHKKPRYSDSRKNTIRKSEKLGTKICEGNFFPEFHSLLSEVLKKFGATPVHSLAELHLLKTRFPDQIRLFGAFLDNEMLASALVYDFEQVAHTQYLASTPKGKETGALDHLLSHLISTPFAGHPYFSFGISTENGGRALNEGLIFQKEGFGARGVVHDFYEMEC